jgi:hypothetical protein
MSDERTVYIERDGQFLEVKLNPEAFSIDESELDRELCNMGRIIFEHGTLEAEARLRVGRLDAEKDRLAAVLDSQIRSEFARLGDKATEAKVGHAITINEEYQTVVQALLQAEKDAATLRWSMTALTHKSECLRALAYRENQSMKADR